MSEVISWAVPDNYNKPLTGWPDIKQWIVQSASVKSGPYTTIATMPSTTDGLPKSDDNLWIDQFEDINGIATTYYQVAAVNSQGSVSTFSEQGKGGFASTFHQVLNLVRLDLGDDDPYFYQLDTIPQFKWTETQLGKNVKASLRDFNGAAPMVTVFTWDNLPEDVIPVLEDWVVYRSLRSRSIKEIANYLKYDDGVSFDMTNRPGDYSKAMKMAYDDVVERTSQWKFSHRPSMIGLGSQRLPFRVTRPLSMLPNMKNVFGF